MDRSLNVANLTVALGDIENLPTPEELRQQLAQAEVDAFFATARPLSESLLATAWTLHQVGTTRRALEIFGAERQVHANAVAAHILELAIRNNDLEAEDALRYSFAAQVSSIRGDRSPNAAALGRRVDLQGAVNLRNPPGAVGVAVCIAVLSMDRATALGVLRVVTGSIEGTTEASVLTVWSSARLSALREIVAGSRELLGFLESGDAEMLASAQASFGRVALAESIVDLDSRWAAAHMLDLCDDLGSTSIWYALPSGSPPSVGRAMALGDPPVMTLWPPQLALLRDDGANPLSPAVKRSVLALPTSAGKTLLMQLAGIHHLATQPNCVCIVAPSHSLCREIRQGLKRRLWVLNEPVVEDGPLGDWERADARIVVMTPEKLSSRLRMNPNELLDKFGLFIFDEAHLVGEASRGWTFETTVARLHELTLVTHHRIILVSAALGGTASIRTWLGVDSRPQQEISKWRGPRRLFATYTIESDLASRRQVAPVGRQRLPRSTVGLQGVVRLYVDSGRALATGTADVGEEVFAGKSSSKPKRPELLLPIVSQAMKAGPVLTVHSSKRGAEEMAATIARAQPESEDTNALVELAAIRLGQFHPLVSILRRGVAYHHAALPVDIQIEIENSVRRGDISVVCATSTLIEGVNLPVRTVVICDRGFRDKTGFKEVLGPAAVMNAAGRAGRAGRETEGWLVIVQQAGGPSARRALLDLDVDLEIGSTLTSVSALEALSEYEGLLTDTMDLTLTDVPPCVDDFLGFCWYLASSTQLLTLDASTSSVLDGVSRLLAWQQLPEETRLRWEGLARRVAASAFDADPGKRSRWAGSGARLSVNARLEALARSFAGDVAMVPKDETESPLSVLKELIAGERLNQFLSLIESRESRFRVRRFGRAEVADVDLRGLILDWLGGEDLSVLASRHLQNVEEGDDGSFRYEQLSAFLARVCEHHLAWSVGVVLAWSAGLTGEELCPRLPAYIHFGVSNANSLALMCAGVRSRRLAQVVGRLASDSAVVPAGLRVWLSSLGPDAWIQMFAPGPAEIADLFEYCQDPSDRSSVDLLNGSTVSVAAVPRSGAEVVGDLMIAPDVSGDPTAGLVVVDTDGRIVAALGAPEYQSFSLLLNSGFTLAASIVDLTESRVVLEVRVRDD